MSVQPGDNCSGCGRLIPGSEGTIAECRLCAAVFCAHCAQVLKMRPDPSICPKCGRSQREAKGHESDASFKFPRIAE